MIQLWIRVFGAALMVAGLYAWISRAILVEIDHWGVAVVIPLHYVLILFGFLLLLLPLLPLHLLVAILPQERTRLLRDFLARAEVVEPAISSDAPVETTARQITDAFRRANRRYYITLFMVFLFLAFVLPFLTAELFDRRAFSAQSTQLAQMVQATSIDANSQDLFRARLSELNTSVPEYSGRETATGFVRDVLLALYSTPRLSRQEFEIRVTEVYDSLTRGSTMAGSGLLSESILQFPCDRSIEPSVACAAPGTLVGILAIRQADHGRFLTPFLQARQALNTAIERTSSSAAIPAAYNARALAYVGLIHRYEDYRALFRDPARRSELEKRFGEQQPLSMLALARRADQDFRLALADDKVTYNRVRYLNNRADLRLHLLGLAHLDGVAFLPANAQELHFLQKTIDPPDSSGAWRGQRLQLILDSLGLDLDEAARLSNHPEVFVTKAQLLSIAGELSRQYQLGGRWGDTTYLFRSALRNLQVASQLGIQPQYFAKERAATLRLRWLWRHPEMHEFHAGLLR